MNNNAKKEMENMGQRAYIEKEIFTQLDKYKKFNKIKKEIEHSEYWGITNRLNTLEEAAELFASRAQTPGGYEYAAAGFEKMNANAQKMKKIVSEYKEWRNSQIDMRGYVTTEMSRISDKVWKLQNTYNAKKDDGDLVGIQIAQYPWYW